MCLEIVHSQISSVSSWLFRICLLRGLTLYMILFFICLFALASPHQEPLQSVDFIFPQLLMLLCIPLVSVQFSLSQDFLCFSTFVKRLAPFFKNRPRGDPPSLPDTNSWKINEKNKNSQNSHDSLGIILIKRPNNQLCISYIFLPSDVEL